MSHRYLKKLCSSAAPERGEVTRVPLRQYVNTLKAEIKSKVSSHIMEFLDEVFSAECSCRFFRTFLLRFAFDSNGTSDEGLHIAQA